jgi:hypothetical protein
MFNKKIQYIYLLKKYIKWGVWRVAACPSYIKDLRFLKVKLIISWVNMTLEGNMNQRVSIDVSRTGIAL